MGTMRVFVLWIAAMAWLGGPTWAPAQDDAEHLSVKNTYLRLILNGNEKDDVPPQDDPRCITGMCAQFGEWVSIQEDDEEAGAFDDLCVRIRGKLGSLIKRRKDFRVDIDDAQALMRIHEDLKINSSDYQVLRKELKDKRNNPKKTPAKELEELVLAISDEVDEAKGNLQKLVVVLKKF